MSTDTQNGSHLTVITTKEQLRTELDRIEALVRAEQARINGLSDPEPDEYEDPDDDPENYPQTDELPHRWRVYAISWLVGLAIVTAGAAGYRLAIEVQPDLDLFRVTQVGSVENE
jgi:hypothetical protein